MQPDKLKILFIGGYSRSGSTILELILGQIDGFFPMGEVHHIWDRSFRDNQLCGCGQSFHSCGFWREVVRTAFGGFDQFDMETARKLKWAVDRKRNIPLTVLAVLRHSYYDKNIKDYSQTLLRLYRAVQEISGCNVIIDSSKNPSHGYLLNTIQGIDLHLLHLVRDSRATSYSWLRKKLRPEVYQRTEYMPVIGAGRSSLQWLLVNSLTNLMHYRNSKYLRIRHEDFVANPNGSLRKILSLTDTEDRPLDFLDGNIVSLETTHTVSGNPSRFNQGRLLIYPDTEWKEALGTRKKWLITSLTWPMLLKYGYRILN